MTVLAEQPRVPAGQEGGGRFASTACPRVYALLDALADEPQRSTRVAIAAPRCPHGHFARWAARNCCGGEVAVLVGAPGSAGEAAPCTGRTNAGDACTRRTTRTDRHGRPACHDHGGRPAAATS